MENAKKHIEQIMNNFNFTQVYHYMKSVDWKWADDDETPSVEQLRVLARDLLTRAAEEEIGEPCFMISTGGFYVVRMYENLTLQFVLTDWESGD